MATLGTRSTPQTQAASLSTDALTGLVDCGNWAVSASWTSTGAVSGIYVAKLTRIDTGGSSHIVFIVRDDARQADVVVQTSDTTWQAYNQYGGGSLLRRAGQQCRHRVCACASRAAKVSYNRPFDTRGHDPQSFLFNAEYPMVRWLEANGYDVKYWAGVDTDRRGADLIGAQKAEGVPLGRPRRVLVRQPADHASRPRATRASTWRSSAATRCSGRRGTSPASMARTRLPDAGQLQGNARARRSIRHAAGRLDRHVARSALQPAGRRRAPGEWRDRHDLDGQLGHHGDHRAGRDGPPALLAEHARRGAHLRRRDAVWAETLGYEWDEDLDNGARPNGLMHLSSTTVTGVEKIIDYGATVGNRHGDAQPDALPAHQRRARLRRRHGAVGVGVGRNHDRGAPARSGHATVDGEPVGRHGRATGHAADRRRSAQAADCRQLVDRYLRADVGHHVAWRPARRSRAAIA